MQLIKGIALLSALLVAANLVHADEEADHDFTERLRPTGEECSKITGANLVFAGKYDADPDKLTISGCSNISDGLTAVCQDSEKFQDARLSLSKALTKIHKVSCEYAPASAKTASVKIQGDMLKVWINIDMPDPSEKARCQIAKTLGVKYKGDLDKACLERAH
jgi:hypothetical protein